MCLEQSFLHSTEIIFMLLIFDGKATFSMSKLLSSYSMDLILRSQYHCVTSHYIAQESVELNVKFGEKLRLYF